KLYSRQGTSFNTRLILIEGRKQKPDGAAPVYNEERDAELKTFEDLYNRVMENMQPRKKTAKPIIPKDDKVKPEWKYLENAYRTFWNLNMKVAPGKPVLVQDGSNFYAFGDAALKIHDATGIPLHEIFLVNEDSFYVEFPVEQADFFFGKMKGKGKEITIGHQTQKPKKNTRNIAEELIEASLELDDEMRRLRGEEELGAPYQPASQSCTVLNTVVPDSMEYETKQALEFIQAQVGGNIDEFVRQRLGYNSKIELCRSLSAEQTDAVAMAIYNIEAREQGMII